jgi:antirestriction protein ArdC
MRSVVHEVTHWTGAAIRLNRKLSNRFGSEAYAAEELIAELGSAFLSAELELESEPRIDHAPYIENWLKVLKNDKRAIFTAASQAQQAADWLLHRMDSGQEAA